jgi:hypothetical protein
MGSGAYGTTVRAAFDLLGRKLWEEQTILKNGLPYTAKLEYFYDRRMARTGMRLPSGRVVYEDRDADGRLAGSGYLVGIHRLSAA